MANGRAKALMGRIKGAVIDKASDVMSAPARAYYGLKSRRSASDAKVLRQARAYDNAPNFDDKGMPTDAFKTRSVADAVRAKYTKRK